MYLQPLLRNPSGKLPNSVKLRRGSGYYAVQRHSRSPILVPIESPYNNIIIISTTMFMVLSSWHSHCESNDYATSIICDFLLVINSNLPPTLHRFRDIPLQKVQNRYIWLFLFGLTPLPPTEGFPWDDLRKNCTWMLMDGQGTQWRRKNCRKF